MNAIIRIFNYRFYVKEALALLLAFFFTEGIFNWIVLPNSMIIEGYVKLLGIFSFLFLLYKYGSLKQNERIIVALFTLFVIKLVLESMAKYDSYFKQLTMFTVLAPVVYMLFIKYLLRSFEIDLLEFTAKFYLYVYVIFMVLFGRGFSFSLELFTMDDYGPFSGDSRIIHASRIFMLIIPFLWYLHQYILTRKNKYLFPFLLVLVAIVIHQHRSVWSSALLALALYLFMSSRNRLISLPRFAGLVINGLILVLLAGFFISNLVPEFLDFMADRFSEIFNPAREGSTGNFRIQQREVYSALAMERPIFGWSFEGFEMENPLVDWWPPGTGQHFHEGYVEMLFYHGIAGLVLKYGVLVYLLFRVFSKRLSAESLILIAFCASALLFSFNYVLPFTFWGVVGMCLYYLDEDDAGREEDEIIDYEMVATNQQQTIPI